MEKYNILIALFMGFESKNYPVNNYWARPTHAIENEEFCYSVGDLKYHESWDWLIPVVEKIETMEFTTQIQHNDCIIYDGENEFRQFGDRRRTKFETTHQAVIDFINWYNEQKS